MSKLSKSIFNIIIYLKNNKYLLKGIAVFCIIICIVFFKQFSMLSIKIYQNWLSPLKGFSCAYAFLHTGEESCSEYGKKVISNYGGFQGVIFLYKRLEDCREAAKSLRNSSCSTINSSENESCEKSCEKVCGECGKNCAGCCKDSCAECAKSCEDFFRKI